MQTCEPKALQKCFSCRKAQPAVATCEFLHKLEIAEFHDEPALVGVATELLEDVPHMSASKS